MTIREATQKWVSEFNAFPQDMIERLMSVFPFEWEEVTIPAVGDRVTVFNVPEDIGTDECDGKIVGYDAGSDEYRILLDSVDVEVKLNTFYFEVIRNDYLYGIMWSFGDDIDNWWLDECGGLQKMSDCGFRIYRHEEWGYFFGINGAGYDFYEEHWIPLYKARGIKWHDDAEEEKRVMLNKGYHLGWIGTKEFWIDSDNNVIKEVKC